MPETERNPHVVRVGWSVDGSDFQLGEDQLSYGYGGTGKSSVNGKFNDYGRPFSVGDVITCCVDLDAQPKAMFYLVNGEYMGVAFKIGPELGDKALFPHVTVKNMKFEVNFGGQWPKYPLAPRFSMLQNIPAAELVRGQEGPSSRQDAEIIMMVGLPASGKTFWAENYCKYHPEKRYYMLGTNNIIDKMRISGLTRKRNYHGRWDVLIKQATGCLNTWFKIAEKRVRNYILDQTNVYFTARRRKMNNFRGYKRIACVIVNEEKVLAERSAKREREEGKIVPQEAVMEMKANFSLPEVGESFDEVRFIEERPPKAFDLVKMFTEEGNHFKRGVKRPSEQSDAHAKVPRMESQRSRDDQPRGGPYQQRGPSSGHDSGRRYDDRERGRDFQRRDDNRRDDRDFQRRDDSRRDDNRRRNEEPGRPPFGRQDERGNRNREFDHRDSHRDDRDRRPDHTDRRENQYDRRHPEREQRDRYQGSNDHRDGREFQIKQEPLDDHQQPMRENQYQGNTSYGQQSSDQNRFDSSQQRQGDGHSSGYQQTRSQELPPNTGGRNQGYQSDKYQGVNADQRSDRNAPQRQGQYQMQQQQQSSYSDQRQTTQSSQRYPNQSSQQYGGQSSEPYSNQSSQAYGGQSSQAYGSQSSQQYGSQSAQQYGSQSAQSYDGQSSAGQSYKNYGTPSSNQSTSGYGSSYDSQSSTSQSSYSYGSSSSAQSYGSNSTTYANQGYGNQQQTIKQEPNSSQGSYSSQSTYNNQAQYSTNPTYNNQTSGYQSQTSAYQATYTQGNQQSYGASEGRPSQQAHSSSQNTPSQQAYSQQSYPNAQSASQQSAYSQPQYGAHQSPYGAQGSQTGNQQYGQQTYNNRSSSNQYYGQQGYSNQASTTQQVPTSKQAYDNQSSYGAAPAQQYGSHKPYGGY